MLHPDDTEISKAEYGAAIDLLNGIMNTVGDIASGEVRAMDMLRLVAFLSGAVLETDTGLSSRADFERAAEYLTQLIVHHAQTIRADRANDGIDGPVDQALDLDDCILMI